MKGHGSKFGQKKEEAVAALLSHRSVDEAARAINLNPNTLLRWLQIPSFGTRIARRAVKQFSKWLRACSRLPVPLASLSSN
jgi:hypothetical protein